jgi:hypothetical protein
MRAPGLAAARNARLFDGGRYDRYHYPQGRRFGSPARGGGRSAFAAPRTGLARSRRIGTGAAVGIGLGLFALGTALARRRPTRLTAGITVAGMANQAPGMGIAATRHSYAVRTTHLPMAVRTMHLPTAILTIRERVIRRRPMHRIPVVLWIVIRALLRVRGY